jgi:hypothetical protein
MINPTSQELVQTLGQQALPIAGESRTSQEGCRTAGLAPNSCNSIRTEFRGCPGYNALELRQGKDVHLDLGVVDLAQGNSNARSDHQDGQGGNVIEGTGGSVNPRPEHGGGAEGTSTLYLPLFLSYLSYAGNTTQSLYQTEGQDGSSALILGCCTVRLD